MSDCTDVRVLITGATSGLGLAMAQALSAAGARVAVVSRDAARAEHVADELGALGLALDVRDEGSVRSCVEAVCGRLGGIDMLVNNAGIGMRTVNPRFMTEPQPFWRVTAAGFRDVLGVMAADLACSPITVNLLLPGGATDTGMIPDEVPAEVRSGLLSPSIMGPPIVWLASPDAAGAHDQRIVATEFPHDNRVS